MFRNIFRHEYFDIDKFCFQNVHFIVDNGIYPFHSHCILECAFNVFKSFRLAFQAIHHRYTSITFTIGLTTMLNYTEQNRLSCSIIHVYFSTL